MALQQQFLSTGGRISQNQSGSRTAVHGESENTDLRGSTAGVERQLSRLRFEQENYHKKRIDVETHSRELNGGIQAMSEERDRLKRTEKSSSYAALPSPVIMGLGASIHNPVIAIFGALMLIVAVALKFYSKNKVTGIGKLLASMQKEYEDVAEELDAIKYQSDKVAAEIRRLEAECA